MWLLLLLRVLWRGGGSGGGGGRSLLPLRPLILLFFYRRFSFPSGEFSSLEGSREKCTRASPLPPPPPVQFLKPILRCLSIYIEDSKNVDEKNSIWHRALQHVFSFRATCAVRTTPVRKRLSLGLAKKTAS